MINNSQHFKISKLKDYLYVINENISLVHPVYTNDPLNMYLILGTNSALLLDTGCGLFSLKPIVNSLIGERKLLIVNTHTHWDHVLGNNEFGEIYIHEAEADIVSQPYDVSYFKDSPNEIIKKYAEQDFLIPPANTIYSIRDDHLFDLGKVIIQVIHTPGHSPGSICLLSNTKELFTSDVAYYGDQFLPKRENFFQVLNTLSKLINICKKENISEIYPSHRKYPCDITLLTELYEGVKNIDKKWGTKEPFDFFQAWKIDDDNGKFRYYISRT
jgi:glyoxylase-like metal-dependent hydrolase (beta-lactamase superfamily II)